MTVEMDIRLNKLHQPVSAVTFYHYLIYVAMKVALLNVRHN